MITVRKQPFERLDVGSLIDALTALVDEEMNHRARRRATWEAEGSPKQPLEAIDAWALMETPREVLIEREWAKDPVHRALRIGVKEVGKLIFARIGDEAMLAMAESVCDRDQAHWELRMSFLNSALDGIGSWHA